ncbi:hypothetical protein C2869_09495 [Saccharobesus litoralis]|uniref:ATP-grasp domain-containing protein n=1 Tax=Saccharobesus litoralis TaxID=2172099 RepID=A0A2S0VR12_9ALTE|nr:ATP-grasp domain-containing protein [Saccharobesus litoralis]AWB66651.1 hypothetical protein C2869_09495 [Saccharobesus litoralis]
MHIAVISYSHDAYQVLRLPEILHKLGCEITLICAPPCLLLQSIYPKQAFVDLAPSFANVDEHQRRIHFAKLLLKEKVNFLLPVKDQEHNDVFAIYDFVLEQDCFSQQEKAQISRLWFDSFGDLYLRRGLASRLNFVDICQQLQLPTPAFVDIRDTEQVETLLQQSSSIMLKLDGSVGGSDVHKIHDLEQLKRFYQANRQYSGIAQTFIKGKVGCFAFAAWRGQYQAGNSALVDATLHHEFSQASRFAVTHIAALETYAQKLVQATQYSGFGSIDFIVKENGDVELIEFNARITKLTTLGDFWRCDPIAALVNKMLNKPWQSSGRDLGKKVSCFPYEWLKNHKADGLSDNVLDIPWSEVHMLQALIKQKLNA